ncbi:alpha mannosidase-like protein [Punctularia strigosozonata HHB-11173 SS5]|uniref:alpha mannosidase-like protein n=1 Tax=Punctularia strigosozonata (strain HHB-11173) TaxID=741275 RepID=UPI00044175CF|nr:alpha mannosidase-like protein [Punctularia strigosozonata HHB-11173 SS5]EIN10701.1 alpha mannosidase-like protein [Punctularia strigosozonata HHB-11173 SS5]
MKWPSALRVVCGTLLLHLWTLPHVGGFARASWTTQRKEEVRNATRELWYHGFNSYMRYAFPLDELTPLSCSGRGPDWTDPTNIAYNDVAGNFSLTLIDVLDTFVVLGDRSGFERAVRDVITWVSFDVNTKPQVFETNIRVLGGLLSAHIFASEPDHIFYLPWYHGELLNMAYDLGNRLLKAFMSPTGLPFARVNLRQGVPLGETWDTCTAGAGSLIMEFGTLSRLTNDDRFEKAASKAFFALWNRKSDIGLVGNTINIWTGKWTHPEVTGIGAGIDSFYEYALKWYIMSGEVEFLDVWQESYAAIMRYARAADGFWFRSVNINTGDIAYWTTDSLSAFWPGLQVLAGDVQNAIKSHLMYWNMWKRHSGLPEVFDTAFQVATSFQYPLRPEFIESTWYLYRATRDPFYLDVGERVLMDIATRAKVDCGLTGIQDLRTNQRDDRMESFVLSETLKYLYLLFDEDNPLHDDDSSYAFSTEGHILMLPRDRIKPLSPIRRKLRGVENLQCPAYEPPVHEYDRPDATTGLTAGVMDRTDFEYTRTLVSVSPTDSEEQRWSPSGWCEVPRVDLFSYDFVMSVNGKPAPEDRSPNIQKLTPVADGYVVHNVTGIRTHIVSRLDGKGYDVTKLGPHAVRSGQIVYINDSALVLAPYDGQGPIDEDRGAIRALSMQMRIFVHDVDPMLDSQVSLREPADEDLVAIAYSALFGGDPSKPLRADQSPVLRFGHGEGMPLVRDTSNRFGCARYTQTYEDVIILLHRGECTFLEKLVHARDAGAAGAVVISDDDFPINPSAGEEDVQAAGASINEVALVVVTRSTGSLIESMMDLVDRGVSGQVMLAVEPEPQTATKARDRQAPTRTEDVRKRDPQQNLYLNGHPLVNTRLIV